MGIPAPLIEFFLQEHRYRPWDGRLLTLGRQTILADAAKLHTLLARHGIAWDSKRAEYDRQTVQARQNPDIAYITDATLFSAFSAARLDVMDVTDYEGANIVHNLCDPIPDHMAGRYDILFNGSVLDNIFDPAAALRNITRLLTPNGRAIHIEMASNLAFEYLIYSTDWFLDYYVVNGFADCRIYICTFETVQELLYGPWHVYNYRPQPDGTAFTLTSLNFKQAVLVIIAEKRASSTVESVPVQWCYRDEAMKAAYNTKLANLSDRRPIFGFGRDPQQVSAIQPGGFLDCGIIARG